MKSKQQLEQSIRKTRQAVLLVNTHSRKGRLLFEAAKSKLEARGYTLIKTFKITQPRQMERTIARAMALQPELLVVGSGDGTLSTVVDHLAYTDTVLGYLPLGTTNNFGRSLHIQPNLDAAIDVIVNGKVAAVDLGKVNDDYFGNMASLGLSVYVAANVSRQLKRRIGRLAYGLYAIKAVIRHKPFRVEVLTADSSHYFYTHQFCVANGSMHGGRPIAADASIDNGMLIAYALGGKSRFSTIIATIKHARTTTDKMRHKNLITAKTFVVRTSPAQSLDVDGEVMPDSTHGRYAFTVAADGLKVLVPQEFPEE